MAEPKTIEQYIADVRGALADVPVRDRDDALAELESLLAADAHVNGEGAAISALGPAAVYAHNVRSALKASPDGPQPQGRVLGLPYDFRGVSVERVGERIWNPAEPRIFTPRLFGVGWTINFGALAVKVGLMRPDDVSDEMFDRIPRAAVRGALAVPALLAAATVALISLSWTSLPAEVPVHWEFSGAPDDWAPKAFAFGLIVAFTVVPVLITYVRVLRPGAPARSRVLSAAGLVLLSTVGLGLTVVTIADADGGRSGGSVGLVVLAGVVVSFLLLYVPARMGLRAEWRASLGETKE